MPDTANAIAGQTTHIVSQGHFANAPDTWTFQNDNTNIANPNATENHEVTSNPNPSAGNNGAVRLNATESGQRWNLASLQYSGTKLADITALGFDVYTNAPNKAYINLDIDFNHPSLSGWQHRLVYIPSSVTPNTWSSHEAVASNGSWQWSRMIAGQATSWPDGITATHRSWGDITAAFPEARITGIDNAAFGSLYLRTDGISTTYYDNVYLATATENIKYNFELPFSGGNSAFLGAEKYVRANVENDLSGAVRVPGAANEVRFHFDGATNLNNIAAYEHLQAGHWPNTQGEKQFRVKTALPAGAYGVTAEYRVDAVWYPVTGSSTVYSIDAPWATYVTPSASRSFFRPSDNPVRVRVDDQFAQFKHMISEVNGVKFAILRDQCDLRQAGNYLFCDVNAATEQTVNGVHYPAWIPLSEGTYTAATTTYTKANNRKDAMLSLPFTIDEVRPTLSNFLVTSPQDAYGANISVQADATDDNGIEYVQFYITAPRALDGVCDGNGQKQRIQYGTLMGGATYGATFDTSALNGMYCLNAVAKDISSHTSQPILRIKVAVDTTAPVWNANPVHVSPLNAAVINDGDEIIMQWEDATDQNGVMYYYNVSAISGETEGDDNYLTYPFYLPFGPLSESEMLATGTAPGTYYWQVKACDNLGNCTAWTDPWSGTVQEVNNETETETPPIINTPQNTGTPTAPTPTLGVAPITPVGSFQTFGFTPAQVGDGIVAATPNTPEILGVTDDAAGDILGTQDTFANSITEESAGPLKLLGVDWRWMLAGLAMLGMLWWVVAAKRRQSQQ